MRLLLESGMMLVPLLELEEVVTVAGIEAGIMQVDLADEGMRGITVRGMVVVVPQGIRGPTRRGMPHRQRIADRRLVDERLPLSVVTIGTGDERPLA